MQAKVLGGLKRCGDSVPVVDLAVIGTQGVQVEHGLGVGEFRFWLASARRRVDCPQQEKENHDTESHEDYVPELGSRSIPADCRRSCHRIYISPCWGPPILLRLPSSLPRSVSWRRTGRHAAESRGCPARAFPCRHALPDRTLSRGKGTGNLPANRPKCRTRRHS